MSDSDNEVFSTHNVFNSREESTVVLAKGPNINTSNLTGLSFQSNVLTSTMNMPKNYWHRHPQPNYNQRTLGYTRETIPMSIASACDMRQSHYNNSFHTGAMSSHRSLYNGRAGSPTMSMRSIDSNATVSAADIVMALKNSTQFSKNDSKIIQEACKKFMKHKARKRIQKRRNLRLFLKGYRRKSGNDSGEFGSISSISSDDDRSTRTHNYKNMSSCRSTTTDISEIKKNIIDTNMFKDCTNNLRRNKMLSMVNGPTLNSSRSSVSSFRSMIDKPTIPKSLPPPVNFNKTQSQMSMNQSTMMTQRDRFTSRFLLPSQRFNRSVAAKSIPETSEKPQVINKQPFSSIINIKHNSCANNPQEPKSDNEEIFSELTTIEKPSKNLRKRSLESNDDNCLPNKKKAKGTSPYKIMTSSNTIDNVQNGFVFAKPTTPVNKSAFIKSKKKCTSTSTNLNPIEKLVSKTSSLSPIKKNPEPKVIEISEDEKDDNTEVHTSQNNTDVSLRPSFIKRKLFSQKMDVTEKISDIAANSPQNSIYGQIQKEKNKARKLVTSQYCLSRDIHTDENNLLDLIHKIVPAERLNSLVKTKKTVTQNNKFEDMDNWNVTSIITTRNNNEEDLSDTFTDEDILIAVGADVSSPKTVKKVNKSPLKNVEKSLLPGGPSINAENKCKKTPEKVSKLSKNVLAEKNGTPTKGVQKYVKSFWDTDFESDAEFTPASRKENNKDVKENKKTDAVARKPKFQGISSMFPMNNATIMNTTVDSTQKFNNTNRSFKLCSHRNSKPKQTAAEKVNSTIQIEPINSKQKAKVNTRLEVSELEKSTHPVNKQVKPEQEKPKPEGKKSPHKKVGKAKAGKDNTSPRGAKDEDKKKNSNNCKTQADENTKTQNKKTKNVQSKTECRNGPDTDQDKTNDKKCAIILLHKVAINHNETTKETKSNKDNKTLSNTDKQQQIKKTKSRKPDPYIRNKNINNNNPKIHNITKTKLSNSLIYEDSLTETNNNSIRPVRSCRISKQNNTLDTSKANQNSIRLVRSCRLSKQNNTSDASNANQTLNITLRPRLKKPENNKSAVRSSITKEQANLSDISFSLAKKKPLSYIKTRLLKAKDSGGKDSSDVSFTLTNDKGSPLKGKGRSNKGRKEAYKTPLYKETVKKILSNEPRPIRTRTPTRKYIF